MKKTVPFELFGQNQFLMFDVLRLAELERAMETSLPIIVKTGNAGVDFCLKALPIAMKQHYHKASPDFFAEKISAHFEAGGNIDQIATPLVKAIALTGVFGDIGKRYANGDVEPDESEIEGKNE